MIFHEVYGCYYNAVAKLLSLAVQGKLTQDNLQKVVNEVAYEESFLNIVPAIKSEEWQLIDQNYDTPVTNIPQMPMTILQKRWLRTIIADPRVKLFIDYLNDDEPSEWDILNECLEGIEPLFYPEDIVYFDRYLDGDPYEDPTYIKNFHIIVKAIRQKQKVRIHFAGAKTIRNDICAPLKIEYSDKEDKFRVLCGWGAKTINMGRIIECELLEEHFSKRFKVSHGVSEVMEFDLINERNTLERAMLKYAHYKKEVMRNDDGTYHVRLEYDLEDETDVVIQIMSFGNNVKILAPDRFIRELSRRMSKQIELMFG